MEHETNTEFTFYVEKSLSNKIIISYNKTEQEEPSWVNFCKDRNIVCSSWVLFEDLFFNKQWRLGLNDSAADTKLVQKKNSKTTLHRYLII